jgi:hypothetical protein
MDKMAKGQDALLVAGSARVNSPEHRDSLPKQKEGRPDKRVDMGVLNLGALEPDQENGNVEQQVVASHCLVGTSSKGEGSPNGH